MHVNSFNVINTPTNIVFPKQRRFLLTSSVKKASLCVICGGISNCRHFGVVCCNACATFFRRTLSGKKNYSCAQNNSCVIESRLSQRICSACRLRKCISAGMNKYKLIAPESKIQNQQQTPQLCDSSLPTIYNNFVLLPGIQKFDLCAQFANYENNLWLRQLLITIKAIEHQRMAYLPPSPYPFRAISYMPNVATQFLNEINLCKMFFNTTDIMSSVGDIVNEKFTDIVSHWTYLTCILNTVKHNSLQNGKLTAIDHSMIGMSEASLKAWYATVPIFHNHLDSIVNVASPVWFKLADLITKIQNLSMTNEEQAFFLFLGMIEGITRLTSDPKVTRLRFQPLLDTVFCSMHTYYRENFSDDSTATRIGNLIMALPIMDEISKLFSELRILVSLCHSDSQKVGFLAAYKNQVERAQSGKNFKMF